jgi:hypothetical protein
VIKKSDPPGAKSKTGESKQGKMKKVARRMKRPLLEQYTVNSSNPALSQGRQD